MSCMGILHFLDVQEEESDRNTVNIRVTLTAAIDIAFSQSRSGLRGIGAHATCVGRVGPREREHPSRCTALGSKEPLVEPQTVQPYP